VLQSFLDLFTICVSLTACLIAFDDNQEGQVFDTSAAVLFSLIQHSCIKIVFLVSNNRLKIAADLL